MLEQFEKIGKEALAGLKKVTDLDSSGRVPHKIPGSKGTSHSNAQPNRPVSR